MPKRSSLEALASATFLLYVQAHHYNPECNMATQLRSGRLDVLPDEIIEHVMTFMDPPQILNVAKTCRRLNERSRENSVWKPVLLRVLLRHTVFLHSLGGRVAHHATSRGGK